MIVGAEAFCSTEITRLSRRGESTGRLLVDGDVDPAVDHDAVRLKQCLSLTAAVRDRPVMGNIIQFSNGMN